MNDSLVFLLAAVTFPRTPGRIGAAARHFTAIAPRIASMVLAGSGCCIFSTAYT